MEIIKPDTGNSGQQPSSGLVTTPKALAATAQSANLNALSYKQTKVVPLRLDHLERHRIVAYNKNSNLSGAFDLLRTQVLKIMEENGWRTLAITSPTPEAGKTVLAINLAMSIAHHTTKTALLVDFDLRRPTVGSCLGLPMDKSLNELLSEQAELQEVLVNPTLPRFVVLPTRQPIPHSTEVLSSPLVSHLITELRERYHERIVIFDLPPLLSSDDAITVLPKFDCVLLVVANGMNSKKEIEESLHHLGTANLIGTVLNKAEPQNRSYY
ncbi:protein tyrosine kinase [Pseudomonas sp. PB120]|uniref:CpsD/CapB family tyrosine-protein kinase n=1 Tax=Pseudomonas sp. PB120 TaxID=2494700 RepID=UPI0012FE46BC|nr:CpsD/CapB family tyrosine-protein kinase [Pseudomonas sp. PB120]MVV48689.1 protein tyrosine kinase [Pseudomonas sp. PB120]